MGLTAMAPQVDIENDSFLVLLTDALRAGPGSPEWHDAVARLKTAGEEVDEYRLLIDAREALASGRDYRSVRARPGFTRKLLTHIDQQEQDLPRRKFPIATIMATLAGLIVVAGLVLAGIELSRHRQTDDGRKTVDDLASTFFPNDVLSTDFDKSIPARFRQLGILPVQANHGLQPAIWASTTGLAGGGIVTAEPLTADQPFSVQVTLRFLHLDEKLIPQIFISNTADFSTDRAMSAHEVVWQLRGKQQEVVVDGTVQPPVPIPDRARTLSVRVVFNRDLAVVESGTQRLWAGPNALGDAPRYIGIRFLSTTGKVEPDVTIESFHLRKN
jgi:hypothetical protein